jgi:adenylosuccinate synthase
VIGIVKAYTTRVGRGPFPTELGDEVTIKKEKRGEELTNIDFDKANKGNEDYQGKILRKQGGEYGTTTERPRRCGWLDSVALKYATSINGINGIVITKLDVLSGLKEIKMCCAYELNGILLEKYPSSMVDLQKVKPIYKTFQGWDKIDIQTWTKIAQGEHPIPNQVKTYLDAITREICKPIYLISIGPERKATLILTDIFT